MSVKSSSRRVQLLCLAIVALLGAQAAGTQVRPPNGPPRHVVIITLDGFGGWALDDPYLPVPTLRALATRGARAKGMRPVNPTVTWPNHTSIVTGVTPAKHGVLFNGVLIREPGVPPRIEPWRNKSEMVRVPTLYDLVHDAAMTTAQVDWVAILNTPSITWEFAERPERPEAKAEISREMVAAGIISQADVDTFATRNIVWRDEVWTNAAVHILREHRPNLLLFHLLALDSTQHRYAPRTPAALTAMAHLDTQVARIVRAIDDAGLTATTTIFVLSDHGFKTVKRQILPNAALMQAGLLTAVDGKITAAQAYVVPEGGSALLYVTVPDNRGEILARAKQALAGLEGIDQAIEPPAYGPYGLPSPSANAQMGAIFLTAKEGYAFAAATGDRAVIDAPEGSLGAHGYISTDPDIQSLFIACGRGIKPGSTLDTVNNVDVAPTAATLLGLEMKDVDGRVLAEILANAPGAAPR
jgi:predicted AlkP superfamily pyrophosphatase or phosphodiesterase